MNKDLIVFPDTCYNQELTDKLGGNPCDTLGHRAPYFYMHGELQYEVGYDCCNFTPELLVRVFSPCVTIVNIYGFDKPALLFTTFRDMHNRLSGLIAFIDDLDGIEHILQDHECFPTDMPWWGEREFLEQNYPETAKLLQINAQQRHLAGRIR